MRKVFALLCSQVVTVHASKVGTPVVSLSCEILPINQTVAISKVYASRGTQKSLLRSN